MQNFKEKHVVITNSETGSFLLDKQQLSKQGLLIIDNKTDQIRVDHIIVTLIEKFFHTSSSPIRRYAPIAFFVWSTNTKNDDERQD